jgi:hypothetical protein
MAGRSRFETISEPDFANVLQVLSSTTKGRAFLHEYLQRSRPEETLGLLQALAQIETTLAGVREELKPERIVDEVRHIAMTLDIALDGAPVDAVGGETARRFALVERARRNWGAGACAAGGNGGIRSDKCRCAARGASLFGGGSACRGRASGDSCGTFGRPVGADAIGEDVIADIAAGEHDDDRPALHLQPSGEEGRQTDGATRLHDEVKLVEGEADGDECLGVARHHPPIRRDRFI